MADVPLPTGLVAILRHPPTERIIRPKNSRAERQRSPAASRIGAPSERRRRLLAGATAHAVPESSGHPERSLENQLYVGG